jgi:hypothetical protein
MDSGSTGVPYCTQTPCAHGCGWPAGPPAPPSPCHPPAAVLATRAFFPRGGEAGRVAHFIEDVDAVHPFAPAPDTGPILGSVIEQQDRHPPGCQIQQGGQDLGGVAPFPFRDALGARAHGVDDDDVKVLHGEAGPPVPILEFRDLLPLHQAEVGDIRHLPPLQSGRDRVLGIVAVQVPDPHRRESMLAKHLADGQLACQFDRHQRLADPKRRRLHRDGAAGQEVFDQPWHLVGGFGQELRHRQRVPPGTIVSPGILRVVVDRGRRDDLGLLQPRGVLDQPAQLVDGMTRHEPLGDALARLYSRRGDPRHPIGNPDDRAGHELGVLRTRRIGRGEEDDRTIGEVGAIRLIPLPQAKRLGGGDQS